MTETKETRLLRAMQVGLDEEIKDVSRKLDALAELVIEMLQALPMAPERKERARAAMDKLVAAQEIATENARRRSERYSSMLRDEGGAGEA
jgi:hypothetical protein